MPILQFQFLYGTIKTLHTCLASEASKKFQFLYGTIKTSSKNGGIQKVMEISIPVWYD